MVAPLIPAFAGLAARLPAPGVIRSAATGDASVASRIASTAARGIGRSILGAGRAAGIVGAPALGGAAGAITGGQQPRSQEQGGDPDNITADETTEVPQPLLIQTDTNNQATKVAPGEGGNIGAKLTDSPLTTLLRSIDGNVRSIRQTLETRPIRDDGDDTRIVREREKVPGQRGVSPLAGLLLGTALIESFRSNLNSIVTSFGESLNSVIQSIADSINSITGFVSATFTAIGESVSNFFGGLLGAASDAQARAEDQAAEGRSQLTPRMADGAGNPGQAAAAAIGRSYTVPTNELSDIVRMIDEPEPGETQEIAAARQAASEDFDRIRAASTGRDITIEEDSVLNQYIEGRREREAMAREAAGLVTPEQRARTEREEEVLRNNQQRVEAAEAANQPPTAVGRWVNNAIDVITGNNLERARENSRMQTEQRERAQVEQRREADMATANERVQALEPDGAELQTYGSTAEADDGAMNRVLERLAGTVRSQQPQPIIVQAPPAPPPQVVPVPTGQSNSPQAPGAGGPITTPRSHPSTLGEAPSPAAQRR